MLKSAAIAALALLGATPYWLTVGGIDSSGNQHALLVNDAGQVQLTCTGKSCTAQLSAVDAGQPFWSIIGGIDSIGNQYPLIGNPGKSAYLITNVSGTVLTHVNATDLNNGTALVGGPWTLNGSVTYNAGASPRPSVGPFSDSNYFSQTSSSPANVGAGPWTVVLLVNPTSVVNEPVAFGTGPGSTGYFLELFSGAAILNGGTGSATANGLVPSSFNIVIAGVDSSGNAFAQINGDLTGTGSVATTASSTATMIGRYSSGTGFSLSGTVTELMVSTAVPSSAAFTNLYNAIVAAE
jgi:hypothetical protein